MTHGKTCLNFVSETRFGINYRRIFEPFNLQMYASNISSLLSGEDAPDELALPSIEDFSEIDLLQLESDELREFIQWRIAQPVKWKAENVAVIVKDKGSFGMMRMFGIYADLSGFRSEANFHVTTEMLDGVRWLLSKSDGSNETAETIAQHFSGL